MANPAQLSLGRPRVVVLATLLLLVYALHRGEPVFLAGYVVTLVIYLRNLVISAGEASGRL